MNWTSYRSAIKEHFKFTKQEINGFLLTALLFGITLSFDQWGESKLEIVTGLKNLAIAILIVGISLFVHHSAQRLTAISMGYKPENKVWWNGLVFGFLITILTNGKLPVYAAGALWITAVETLRVGKKPAGENMQEFGKIAATGPIANICLAALIKTIDWVFIPLPEWLVITVFNFNLLLAFYQFLPMPPLDGSRIFYASRQSYVFFLGFFLAYVTQVFVLGYFSFITAFIIAVMLWISYFAIFEVTQ